MILVKCQLRPLFIAVPSGPQLGGYHCVGRRYIRIMTAIYDKISSDMRTPTQRAQYGPARSIPLLPCLSFRQILPQCSEKYLARCTGAPSWRLLMRVRNTGLCGNSSGCTSNTAHPARYLALRIWMTPRQRPGRLGSLQYSTAGGYLLWVY